MAGIYGVQGVSVPRITVARRAGPGGFKVETDAAAGPGAALAVAMPSLLGLQEAQQDAVSDREARRHADEMLDLLKELQRSLLGAAIDPAKLGRMAQLARHAPPPADPRLLAVQRALLVRVAVEQARTRIAASP